MFPVLRDEPDRAEKLAQSPWRARSMQLVTLLGLVSLCLFAAWQGYKRQQQDIPAPTARASGPPVQTDSGRGDTQTVQNNPKADGVNASPSLPASVPEQDASSLRWPFWEFRLRQPVPPREPSLTPLTWRLIGASLSAGKWTLIILKQGTTAPEYLGVGEQLPGGYRIDAINDQDVTLSKGKQVMVLSYLGSR